MKIALASDLHFEFHSETPTWIPPLPSQCDVLVLAGNHEFYRSVINFELERFRETFASHARIHFLENEAVTIQGVTFLGCSLWTGFELLGLERQEEAMAEAERLINDFSLIGLVEEGAGFDWRPFTPTDARQRYLDSRRWLESSLKGCVPERTVVVTHFPPLFELTDKRYPVGPLTAYYQADCSDLVDTYQPALWLHGHTHWSGQLYRGNTQIISNQLGYPGEQDIPLYNPNLILKLVASSHS